MTVLGNDDGQIPVARSTVRIGDKLVGDGQSCFIIAEIGINHNGDLDLAIAVGVLAAAGNIPPATVAKVGLIGELALDGRVRAVRGALVLASCLVHSDCTRVIVPVGNAAEASLLGDRAPEIIDGLGPLLEALATERRLSVASRQRSRWRASTIRWA